MIQEIMYGLQIEALLHFGEGSQAGVRRHCRRQQQRPACGRARGSGVLSSCGSICNMLFKRLGSKQEQAMHKPNSLTGLLTVEPGTCPCHGLLGSSGPRCTAVWGPDRAAGGGRHAMCYTAHFAELQGQWASSIECTKCVNVRQHAFTALQALAWRQAGAARRASPGGRRQRAAGIAALLSPCGAAARRAALPG